jgi:hypothetical protein
MACRATMHPPLLLNPRNFPLLCAYPRNLSKSDCEKIRRRRLSTNDYAHLTDTSHEGAVPALIRCTEDDTDSTASRFTRLAAAKAIWEITGDAGLCVPIWERLLADSECWARRYAVELMEEIAHPAAIPALQSRLDDSRVEVRRAARKAIEKIEDGST